MNDYLKQRMLDGSETEGHYSDMEKMAKLPPGTKFIALSGRKQVGKDTAARMIVEELRKNGKTASVTSFAEPLKRMCIDILGLKADEVYGTDDDKNKLSTINWDGFPEEIRLKYATEFILCKDGVSDPKPRSGLMTNREVLQVMGTDLFRAISNNVWAQAPFNRKWDTDFVILTDCRFPNEKLVTEANGGVIIRLERDTGFSDNHPSETALDDVHFKHTYTNNGSLEDLQQFIKALLWNLM